MKNLRLSKRNDDVAAAKAITILATPTLENLQAYKMGLIDDSGNKQREPKTQAEKAAYSRLTQLMIEIRKLLLNHRFNPSITGKELKRRFSFRPDLSADDFELSLESFDGSDLMSVMESCIDELSDEELKDTLTALKDEVLDDIEKEPIEYTDSEKELLSKMGLPTDYQPTEKDSILLSILQKKKGWLVAAMHQVSNEDEPSS